MSIYVDKLYPHGWKLGPNCHMIADSLEELHAFASRLQLRRAWFQNAASLPHYDLTEKRRAAAVKLGAIEVDRKFIAGRIKAKREADAAAPKEQTE